MKLFKNIYTLVKCLIPPFYLHKLLKIKHRNVHIYISIPIFLFIYLIWKILYTKYIGNCCPTRVIIYRSMYTYIPSLQYKVKIDLDVIEQISYVLNVCEIIIILHT